MSKALLLESQLGASGRHGASLRSLGARLERRIDASPKRAFLCLTALYFVVVLMLSSMKLLWLDELITLHIARLGNSAAIWNALARGADPNPPLSHFLVHFSRMLFGEHEFALRMPAALGYWIGLFSLFSYLLRRLPGTWALGGTVLSMTMAAFDYSYESRSYAIFYGFTMLAFLCWSRGVDPTRSLSRRRLAIVAMVFALAAGISTNYFAVLAFLPIAAGEFARTVRQAYNVSQQPSGFSRLNSTTLLQEIDFPIWIALGIAATPLLAYRSMIANSIAQFAPYAWNKVSLDQVNDSYMEMVEIVLYPILALLAFAIVVRLFAHYLAPACSACRSRLRPRWAGTLLARASSRVAVPLHEGVGIFFLMAYPFLGYLVASIHGGMLSPRFVIPVCFGFAIATTLVAFQLFQEVPHAGVVLLCLWLAWFLCRESVVGYWYEEQKQSFYKVLNHLPEAESAGLSEAPIVIPEPLMALTFQHYAPPSIAARVVFPVDFTAIRRYRHDDSPEENLWAGRDFLYRMPIVPLATFQRTVGHYLIVASDSNWLLEDLNHHRYSLQRLNINSRAGALGGFTPLCHGVPAFYIASGDKYANYVLSPDSQPIPLRLADDLPGAEATPNAIIASERREK